MKINVEKEVKELQFLASLPEEVQIAYVDAGYWEAAFVYVEGDKILIWDGNEYALEDCEDFREYLVRQLERKRNLLHKTIESLRKATKKA